MRPIYDKDAPIALMLDDVIELECGQSKAPLVTPGSVMDVNLILQTEIQELIRELAHANTLMFVFAAASVVLGVVLIGRWK